MTVVHRLKECHKPGHIQALLVQDTRKTSFPPTEVIIAAERTVSWTLTVKYIGVAIDEKSNFTALEPSLYKRQDSKQESRIQRLEKVEELVLLPKKYSKLTDR